MLGRFLKDESGATAIEYALIGSLISLAIISGMAGISNGVRVMFNKAADEFQP